MLKPNNAGGGVSTYHENEISGRTRNDIGRHENLLDRIIHRTLERDGVLIQDNEQTYLDLTQTDLQVSFNAASVRYRSAMVRIAVRKR